MDFFETMLQQKLAGGSGGSNDFSTAEVTIVSTNASAYLLFYSTLYDEVLNSNILTGIVKIGDSKWTNEYGWSGVQDTNMQIVFLSDSTSFTASNTNAVACTGDASAVFDDENEEWNITITGDCTITLS